MSRQAEMSDIDEAVEDAWNAIAPMVLEEAARICEDEAREAIKHEGRDQEFMSAGASTCAVIIRAMK